MKQFVIDSTSSATKVADATQCVEIARNGVDAITEKISTVSNSLNAIKGNGKQAENKRKRLTDALATFNADLNTAKVRLELAESELNDANNNANNVNKVIAFANNAKEVAKQTALQAYENAEKAAKKYVTKSLTDAATQSFEREMINSTAIEAKKSAFNDATAKLTELAHNANPFVVEATKDINLPAIVNFVCEKITTATAQKVVNHNAQTEISKLAEKAAKVSAKPDASALIDAVNKYANENAVRCSWLFIKLKQSGEIGNIETYSTKVNNVNERALNKCLILTALAKEFATQSPNAIFDNCNRDLKRINNVLGSSFAYYVGADNKVLTQNGVQAVFVNSVGDTFRYASPTTANGKKKRTDVISHLLANNLTVDIKLPAVREYVEDLLTEIAGKQIFAKVLTTNLRVIESSTL